MANIGSWFEIPTDNIESSKNFYQNVFEVEMTIMEMGPTVMAMFPYETGGAGSGGAVIQGEGYNTAPNGSGSIVYLNSDNINATLERVQQNGGTVLLPLTDIGENGTIAQFLDNVGNRVALHTSPTGH